MQMQTTTDQTALRPFHETVVEAIRGATSIELLYLAPLIKATKIPKGHDEIIAAWNERRKSMYRGDEDLGVPGSLLEQKEATAKKSDGEKRDFGLVLDELQQETEKLLSLLKDRQPGFITWGMFMQDHLRNLHKLTLQALGE